MIKESAYKLYESVKPSHINYDLNTDMDDSTIAIHDIGVETTYAFFEYESLYYCVSFQKAPHRYIQNHYDLDEYDLGFGVSDEKSI